MASITEIRQQYPQYNDMTDSQIADALHRKFYADMPRAAFDAKIGLQQQGEPSGVADSRGSMLDAALKPITSYPDTYNQMRGEALDQMAIGAGQLANAFGGENVDGRAWEAAKGAGNTAFGALGYVTSPVNAGLRTIVGVPIEENTGIPKEYSEFAASLALPAAALQKAGTVTKAGSALKPGQEVANAASRLGVDIPRAVATDSTALQRTAAAVRNVPLAGDPIIKAAEKSVAQLADKAKDVARGYGSGTIHGAGEAAGGAIKRYITGQTADRARKLYDNVDNFVDHNVTAPLSNAMRVAKEIMDERIAAAMDPNSKAMGMIADAVQRPGGLTYDGIKKLRSAVGETLNSGILPEGISQGELKRIYGALTDDYRAITNVAGGARANAALNRADRYYRLVSDRREQLAKIVGANGNAPVEQVFDRLLAMAGSTSRADIGTLAKARKAIGSDDWNEFVSGVVAQMGRNPTTRGAPEVLQTIDFSPERFLTAYSKMSNSGRSLLFSSGGKSDLAAHLKDIAAVSTRFKELQKFANPSGTGQTVAGAGIGAGVFADPVTTVATVVGGRLMATVLSRPASAASVAQFSRRYEVALRKPSPATFAGLSIAARNLANTLSDIGISTSADDFLRAIQGSVKASAEDEQN